MRKGLKVLLTVIPFLALLTSSGCLVLKSELDAAKQANGLVNQQLKTARQKINLLQEDSKKLIADSKDRIATNEIQKEQIALIKTECDRLEQSFYDLDVLYQKEINRDDVLVLGAQLPVQIDRALRGFAQSNPQIMEYLPKYGMVKMKADLSFASGAATVNPGATKALAKLVAILQDPAAKELNVYIAGHTDDVTSFTAATRQKHANNWYLSVHRAIGVQKVLTAAGLASTKIAVMGFGEYHPVAPNKTSSTGKKLGNKLNRRVEIWIVPANRFLTIPDKETKEPPPAPPATP